MIAALTGTAPWLPQKESCAGLYVMEARWWVKLPAQTFIDACKHPQLMPQLRSSILQTSAQTPALILTLTLTLNLTVTLAQAAADPQRLGIHGRDVHRHHRAVHQLRHSNLPAHHNRPKPTSCRVRPVTSLFAPESHHLRVRTGVERIQTCFGCLFVIGGPVLGKSGCAEPAHEPPKLPCLGTART